MIWNYKHPKLQDISDVFSTAEGSKSALRVLLCLLSLSSQLTDPVAPFPLPFSLSLPLIPTASRRLASSKVSQ